ncbi:centromere-associated protein E-like [Chelonus insularis]|uniref:centromere-associated protein E-like n=1 Tax=Chelonus insularis TaxID=460826 RepID=UPI00158942D7|nr:centromere-associated protein E-like [Chelonus insularis]XP_034942839.1 centromere-associated protein E-like [Chelonus insularis]
MNYEMKTKITGKDLYAKFQELMPGGVLKKITPEILNEICNHPSTQPFLKWFYEYVGPDNILTREEMRLRENLKTSGQWHTGKELDDALEEALKDTPELMSLIEANKNYEMELTKQYEQEKEAYEADLKDLKAFEEELRRIKQLNTKLSEDLEKEETMLLKLQIQSDEAYEDCCKDAEKFDTVHHELYNALQSLLKVYGDAAQMRGPPVTWTQMPLESFVNQIEAHYKYIQIHIQKEHKNLMISEETSVIPENASVTTDESENERTEMEKAQELMRCQKDLEASTLHKIEAEMDMASSEAIHLKAAEIYNDGDTKFPKSQVQKNMEIAQMLSQKDLLEEENLILESQLKESVERFAKLSMTKVLIEEAENRLERKQRRLKKFQNFLYFARDLGHSSADLLILLMQLELQKFQKIINLTTSARSYLQMEYTCSAKRTEIMKELQTQFDKITSLPLNEQNIYNKICTEIIVNNANTSDAFNLAEEKYKDIIKENDKLKKEIVKTDLDDIVQKLKLLKDSLIIAYDKEMSGATKSFRYMPDDLALQFATVLKKSETVQTLFNEQRKKFKYFTDKISKDPIEREKEILWQKFLANPDGLKERYEKLQSIAERSLFVNSLNCE